MPFYPKTKSSIRWWKRPALATPFITILTFSVCASMEFEHSTDPMLAVFSRACIPIIIFFVLCLAGILVGERDEIADDVDGFFRDIKRLSNKWVRKTT